MCIHKSVAILLILALLAAGAEWMQGSARAVTQDEIDALREEQAGHRSRIEELEGQLADIQGDQSRALEEKQVLEAELSAIQAELDSIDAQITYYDGQIAQKEVEYQAAKARETEQYERFCERVRAMEEAGNVSYLAILFNAADFSDLLDRAFMVGEIVDYDQAIMDQLTAARQEIEQIMGELESARAGQQAARDEQAARRQLQSEKVAQARAVVERINADADLLNQALAQEELEENRIGAEIVSKQKELEAQRQQNSVTLPSSSGGFLWPLSGYTSVNSGYGYREHPTTGLYSMHTGIDIPAPTGVPIRAVKGGQVVTATTQGGTYGTYVVVDHGGGDSSLYAHMSRLNCSSGDMVSQGDIIGYVGATGRVTGAHLHLEIRLNYQRVNPMSVY